VKRGYGAQAGHNPAKRGKPTESKHETQTLARAGGGKDAALQLRGGGNAADGSKGSMLVSKIRTRAAACHIQSLGGWDHHRGQGCKQRKGESKGSQKPESLIRKNTMITER